MKDKRYSVVGLGEILWDLLPAGKQLGGAPANFAYHAHVLGADACVVSCVGNDALGREILDRVDGLHLDRRFIQVSEQHPTGTVDVELDAERDPRYVIREDVAWDFIGMTPDLLALARQSDAVCFGTLCQRSAGSRKTIQQFLKATRRECLRVLDLNLRQSFFNEKTIIESIKAANVLKLNRDELQIVGAMLSMSGADYEIISQLLDDSSIRVVAFTRGAEGSILQTVEFVSRHPGFEVSVVDTVGAGDAFTAALVMGLMKSKDLDAINNAANRLGSYLCSRPGATPEIPKELVESLYSK